MNIKKIFSVTVATIFISTSIIVPKSYANQENEYETYIKTKQKSYNFENNDLPEEVKSDLKEENNIKYFKLKTDSNYEIALAYENGKYTFYKEAKTLEEAKSIANDIKDEYIDQDIIPTVINNEGIIEYTTNSIGRIVKIADGTSEDSTGFTVNLYKDSDKKSEYTYINHRYIDDEPILDETETMTNLEVSGFTG